MNVSSRTRKIAITGILSAIVIILGITGIGFVPIGPTKATFMHLPVIIAALLEGPIVGLITGLLFGLMSIYNAITAPTVVAFAFLNPLVSVLPRILIPIVSFYVYKLIRRKTSENKAKNLRNDGLSIAIAAIAGSLTNTIGVLGMIYILYAKEFAAAIQMEASKVLDYLFIGVGVAQGLPEAAFMAIISVPVIIAVKTAKLSSLNY